MVAQGDLILEFPGVRVHVLVIRLLMLGHDVEGITDVDADLFVFGCVIDAVFPREKDAALGVFLINAHIAGRQRNAQAVFFFVFEFVVDHHGIFQRRAGGLLIAIVGTLAVDGENLFDRDTGALKQADLLGFLVFDGSFAAERVEMIFAEGFLLELRCCSLVHARFPEGQGIDGGRGLHTVQFTGDEFEVRVVKAGAAVVDDGNPAVEVRVLVVPSDREDVIGVPGKVVGKIGSLNLLLAGAGIFQRHNERWTVVKIRRNLREAIALGEHSGHDVRADFPDRSVVVGK